VGVGACAVEDPLFSIGCELDIIHLCIPNRFSRSELMTAEIVAVGRVALCQVPFCKGKVELKHVKIHC